MNDENKLMLYCEGFFMSFLGGWFNMMRVMGKYLRF